MVIVTSAPMTAKAIWFTTSGITGFTLPGMIDDPACRGGRRISAKPACGPLESSRRSLQIFDSFTAVRRSTAEAWRNPPASHVASKRCAAGVTGSPLSARRCSIDRLAVPGRRGHPGSDRRGAEAASRAGAGGLSDPRDVLAHGHGEGRELVAERHGHGVLQLRAPDLPHVGEGRAALGERVREPVQLGHQFAERGDDGQSDRRRVDVVRGLAAVHVVDRVDHVVAAPLVAEPLQRRVGDDLVGVHVGAGAGAALHDVDAELVVQLAAPHPLAGVLDRRRLGRP